MKKNLLLALMALSCTMPLVKTAATTPATNNTDDQVLLTIDGKPVMASEFLYIYAKNSESTEDRKSMEEYMDLFVNFKLKVIEAEDAGIDTTEAFKKELAGYRAQATPKYMKDEEAIDSLIRLSYDHMSRDRRAAHIAIQCPMTADDSTQAAALERINLIRQRVTTGLPVKKGKKTVQQPEDFFAVAAEVSEDPGLKETNGELGWITPFRYVYSFEEAVYNTPVGEITPAFRSPFGWHIAWVEEERPHSEVRASHIMKMVPQGNDSASAIARAQLDSIYTLLANGADFAEMASANSDDKGSAMRGGDLNWFGRGMMVKPFEDAVFALADGEMSQPFQSRFGWHIAKVTGHRPMQPIDSIYDKIAKNVQRDERGKEADKSFIRKMKAEYQLPDTMSDADVRAVADSHLEEKYTDLRHLVQEYHDGILLFDISLEKVWNKAAKDEEGLTRYFQAHKKDYTWDAPRYKGYVIYAKDKASATQAKSIIKNANPDSVLSYINTRINNDSVKFVKIEHGLWKKGQNAAADKYGFKDKAAEYTPTEDMPVVMVVGKVLKAPEVYTDERGKVTSAYQDELEKAWIEELRAKHTVVINYDVLNELKIKH